VILAVKGLGLGFSAAASPGPLQALLLQAASRTGPLRTLHLALVPLVSDAPVVAACVLALSGLPDGFIRVLQLAGGALLTWMGASALRDLWRPAAGEAAAAPATGFWRAVLVNVTNPNAWIFWSLVGGPILAAALRRAPADALLFLAGFYLSITTTNAALILAFGAVGRLGPGVARGLGGVSAVAFLVLGLAQLWKAGTGGP
jgi:threonine/homoserine/homoserine lactone efflux protein